MNLFTLVAPFLVCTNTLSNPVLPKPPEPYEYLIVAAEVVPAFMLHTLMHESGHALAAKSMGMEVTNFQPYPGRCGDVFAFGCTSINRGNSNVHQDIFLSSAGMLLTRIGAESIDLMMDNVDLHPRVQQFGAIMYFLGRLDSVRYIFRCAFASCGEPHDSYVIASSITQNTEAQKWIFGGMIALTVLDLLLDVDEIEKNWKRVWMLN
jgi:hypothetical protein